MDAESAEFPKVTAVAVNWNSAALTITLFESIAEAFGQGLRAVVVDNGSADDSVEVLRTFIATRGYETQITLLPLAENLGFTGGVNAGAEAALAATDPPAFIWLLNPDVTTNVRTLNEMVAVALESKAGIVACGSEYLKVDAWPKPFWTWRRNDHWSATKQGRWWPIGAYFGHCVIFDAALVKSLIEADGHFQDPGLFMDWDEWECSLRAKRLGAKIVMARDTEVVHDGGFRTLGKSRRAELRQYYAARNGVSVSRRFMPAWQFWLLLPVRIARDASWFARVRLRGETPHPGCYLLGTLDAFRGRTGRWSQHPADAPVGAAPRLLPQHVSPDAKR
ncbi:MAG: glycosyltransferase family 2 protein [bacterium]